MTDEWDEIGGKIVDEHIDYWDGDSKLATVIAAALRQAAAKGPQWRGIDSAPRDGTMVILYPNWRIAWWEFGDEQWMFHATPVDFIDGRAMISSCPDKAPGFYCHYTGHEEGEEPTHWMPLPAKPATEDEPT